MQDGTSIHELSDVVDNSCSVIFVDNNINLMTIIGTIDNKGSFDANITIKGDGFDHQSEDLPVCVNDICESLEKSASFIQCSFVTQQGTAYSCIFYCSCTNCDKLYIQIQRFARVRMDVSLWEMFVKYQLHIKCCFLCVSLKSGLNTFDFNI